MARQLSIRGSYRPPLLTSLLPSLPPHTIISLPVQTALCAYLPAGAPASLMGVQLLVIGLYLAPVPVNRFDELEPPHTINSKPLQTAAW